MKNKKGEIQRKRIIIYYALAIVLPCLMLGILAFRGIKNDQVVVGVFFIAESDLPSLLNYGLLYFPDNYLTASDLTGPQSRHFIWEGGWRFKLREKDYRKALEYYRSIICT